MSLLPFPIPVYFDYNGDALEDGYIYVGEAGQSARENPIQVYWDANLTQTAAQPIRTSGGYPTYQGAPSGLFIAESACSVTVLDKNQQIILLDEGVDATTDFAGPDGASMVGVLGGGTVQDKLTSLQPFIDYHRYEVGPLGINSIDNSPANDIAGGVSGSVVAGATVSNPNLIGFLQNENIFFGAGSNVTWTSTYNVSTVNDVKPILIRADNVRVTLPNIPGSYTAAIVGGKFQMTYPLPGHFVNDGPGGSEGTNPYVLPTQKIILQQRSTTEVTNSETDYSGIYGGYDCITYKGIMQHLIGAHHRIRSEGTTGNNAVNGDHNSIFGGSYGTIRSGYYGIILGGTGNEINTGGTGSQGSIIAGGSYNTLTGPSAGIFASSSSTASGTRAVIMGGSSNVASGNGAMVTGRSNTSSGQDSITAGNSNTNSAAYAATFGLSNTVSGSGYNFTAGRSNTVSGQYSNAIGFTHTVTGIGSTALGIEAKGASNVTQVLGAGKFAAVGDAQTSVVALKATTTTTSATGMRAYTGGQNRMIIPSDSTWAFRVLIVARRSDADNESGGYEITGVIDNNAGTVALVGTPTVTVIAEDTAAWDVQAVADNTNKALDIQVIGENAKTILWVGRCELAEVTG